MHYSIVVLIRVYKQIRDSLFGHNLPVCIDDNDHTKPKDFDLHVSLQYVHLKNDLRRNTTVRYDVGKQVPTVFVFRRLSSLRYSIFSTFKQNSSVPTYKRRYSLFTLESWNARMIACRFISTNQIESDKEIDWFILRVVIRMESSQYHTKVTWPAGGDRTENEAYWRFFLNPKHATLSNVWLIESTCTVL